MFATQQMAAAHMSPHPNARIASLAQEAAASAS
jgi:hypothetical protein